MKKLFMTAVAIFFLMFAFFVSRLNADDQPPLAAGEAGISMDFKDASLKDILKVFSIQAGMNFIASEAVQDRKITLYLDKVPLSQAMDKIFSANNLSYELDSKANIFVVKEWGKMETETVTRVFYLKHATVSISSLKEELSKSLVGITSSAASSSSNRSKYKEEGEGGISSAVKKLLSGVGSMMEDFRTNSIIVTDTPMKMKVISQVIASLDVAVPQVILEVEMLDVSKDAVDKMGFRFGDTPFTAIITGATAATGFPYGDWTKTFEAAKGILSINPSGSTYEMQLDYMRTLTDTKFLARPKLLTLNNETAEISITKDEIVGRKDTVETTSAGSTTSSEYQRSTDLVLTKEGTGIFLRVTPQINIDTNEITMVINPKSSVSSISTLSSSANPQSDVEVRMTKSIVKVKDGETVILGGLIHQDKNLITKKLPILGDLPIIGTFFRHKEKTIDKERELIVFITPRIVKDKVDLEMTQMPAMQLPIREQGVAAASNRDYIINSNMNKFDKSIHGKR
ncbi:MAG TPA: secretin N-terminal domain-containing protein [Candidatus Omnitrophota bacterium]|nr:secretin N-terminal domain-containing protein [Candidatus Omnitrophota bacterium]HPT39448.1 secretin N-terminal domain-containing protein [Candidatus Omnitrophota bacterium]